MPGADPPWRQLKDLWSHNAFPKAEPISCDLRQARSFAVRAAQRSQVEFFWLCGTCAGNFSIDTGLDGSVHLVASQRPLNEGLYHHAVAVWPSGRENSYSLNGSLKERTARPPDRLRAAGRNKG
jgi:hypothetical protein